MPDAAPGLCRKTEDLDPLGVPVQRKVTLFPEIGIPGAKRAKSQIQLPRFGPARVQATSDDQGWGSSPCRRTPRFTGARHRTNDPDHDFGGLPFASQ